MDNNTEKKNGRYKWNEDYTISLIGEEAMWLQLAEEASELSQAACKMARYLHRTNPVARSETSIRSDVIEEFSDVINCARHLAIPINEELIDYKNHRWINRIEGMNDGVE